MPYDAASEHAARRRAPSSLPLWLTRPPTWAAALGYPPRVSLTTVLFWLLFALLSVAACTTSSAGVVAQVELPASPSPRIEQRSLQAPAFDPASSGAAPIQSRPSADAPSIVMPPVGGPALLPPDAQRQAVQRELHRLQRLAESAQPVGRSVVSAQAAWQLGLVYLHGAGVRQDTAQAQRWFEQAARFGREPWVYAGLAWCHIEGCVGPPDPTAAARAIAQLRPAHPARADFLAWVQASRQPQPQAARPGANALPARAAQGPSMALLRKAAAAGDLHARIELGMEALSQDRPDQAEQFFRQAAPLSPAAAYNLRELQTRSGAQDAADAGGSDAAAALEQARKYHRGEGVPANFSEAIRYYRLAEQRGSVQAHRMLALIQSRPAPGGGVDILWMQQLARADPAAVGLTIGSPVTAHQLLREPTPLADLLPAFWRRQLAPVGQ